MKYIVAVSGGIDSVVLLDVLVKRAEHELVVAHFDHGIRKDSVEDEQLVRKLAEKYSLVYETRQVELGEGASEAEARDARYAWLQAVKENHNADAIVTAHHQDDVIETMIINLIRGTGWRGLISLSDHDEVIRPLLSWSKQYIVTYAIDNQLEWHEDSTNDDLRYLRNFVRYRFVQRMTESERQRWIKLYESQSRVGKQINEELQKVRIGDTADRYTLIMSGRAVAGEVLMGSYGRMEKSTLDQLWHFICTGKPGKSYVQGGRRYQLTARELIVSTHKS